MRINYSIIIPHKNTPSLLQRCLDSIPYRNDIQVIIVDDNSDTKELDFATFPGLNRKDTEIYFTKEGKGAGYARNIGLRHAKGKWLIFADADDFFLPIFDRMLDDYRDNENDIVYFKNVSVYSDTLLPHNRGNYINETLDNIQKTNNWNSIYYLNSPCAKFIKKDLVDTNHIQFQEVRYANDVFFSLSSSVAATKKMIANYELYCITYRENSLTTPSLESLLVRFEVSLNANAHFKNIIDTDPGIFFIWIKIYKLDKKIALKLIKNLIEKLGIILSLRDFIFFLKVTFIGKIKKLFKKNYESQ